MPAFDLVTIGCEFGGGMTIDWIGGEVRLCVWGWC